MSKKIKKAVVAVAGSGTRLLPATKAQPKEMLPIVDKPIIQLVAEELVEAGIEDIIFVTRWDKKPLEDHFDHSLALEYDLKKNGKEELSQAMSDLAEMANFVYVRQKPQYGNGVPILSAASLVDDEPFVFCFGDDLVKSKVSFTKQMVEEYEKNENLMVGVQEVPLEEVSKYGIANLVEGSMQIDKLVEKPSIEEVNSRLAVFGRYILNQEIIDTLKNTAIGKGNELWVSDAIENYIKDGGKFYAKKVEDGEWMTTGDPMNYLKATLAYAMDRNDIGGELKNYIKDFHC